MESHEGDLRSEVKNDEQRKAVQEDYRSAGLSPRELSLLDFAVKLTLQLTDVQRTDLDNLRSHGLDDEQIVDAVHCISYFNFITRVLHALGVDPEPSMRYGQRH